MQLFSHECDQLWSPSPSPSPSSAMTLRSPVKLRVVLRFLFSMLECARCQIIIWPDHVSLINVFVICFNHWIIAVYVPLIYGLIIFRRAPWLTMSLMWSLAPRSTWRWSCHTFTWTSSLSSPSTRCTWTVRAAACTVWWWPAWRWPIS